MLDLDQEFLLLQEFVVRARANLPLETWDYLIGGAETETTLKRNRLALDRLGFRPRVLRDVSQIDSSARLLGERLRIPILLAPIGSLQDLDPGGGATAARAAGEYGVFHMQSSSSEPGLEATARASDGAKIFQLYVRSDADSVRDYVRWATAAGYRAFCFTVDTDHYSRRERDLAKRYRATARRGVSGIEFQKRFSWDDFDRVRDACELPLVLKGIATAEDASLACEHGADVVYVSNHGGRQLDHGRATIDILPEVVRAVDGRAEVIVDGGFLRGTDVVKALALGATAVGVGRLVGFSIAAGGAAGLVRMLEILEHEIVTCLGLLGVSSFDQLDGSYVQAVEPVTSAHVMSAFPLLEEGY